MSRDNRWSTHHILPRSRGGTNEEDNLLRIKIWPHQSLHTLFDNKLIAEQLIKTVELSEKAMRPEVVEWLIETLTAHDPKDLDYWYKDWTHF